MCFAWASGTPFPAGKKPTENQANTLSLFWSSGCRSVTVKSSTQVFSSQHSHADKAQETSAGSHKAYKLCRCKFSMIPPSVPLPYLRVINPDLAAEEEYGDLHTAILRLNEKSVSRTSSNPATDPEVPRGQTPQMNEQNSVLWSCWFRHITPQGAGYGGVRQSDQLSNNQYLAMPGDEKPAESTPGPNEATLSLGTPITAAAHVRPGDPREHSGIADPEASPSSKHPELPRTAADVRESMQVQLLSVPAAYNSKLRNDWTGLESGMVRPHPGMSVGPQLRDLFNLDDLPSPSALEQPQAAGQLAPQLAGATDRDQQPQFTAEPFQVVFPCQGVPPAARRPASVSFGSADLLQALRNPAVEDLLHDPTLEAAFDRLAGLTPASPAMAPTRAEAFQAPQGLPSLSRFGHGSQADFQLPLGAPANSNVAATCRENEGFLARLEAKRRAAEHTWRFHTGEAASAMHECNRLDADILALTQGAHGHHFVAADN
ncbi:hypothetical protein WJX74_006923 [Apatococcus lobatus]|uniref:Uncharacterized protein n=1 Tax=Apatococcus lobatus TaxID=904363 RepID=A0AAW1QWY5_9CHLO